MYGDTAAARRRVGQLREQAGDIRAMADHLVARSEAVPWRGRAAEAMRTRIRERAAQLRAAAEHHETAADSLARHLGEVDVVKDAIATREHKAAALVEDARARAAAAEHDAGAEVDEADALLLSFDPPPPGHHEWLGVSLPGL
ncbi:MAG: hypothetical protein LT071_09205 [Nocardioides sp.]|nr:hypothetical protein [Nocardioides sp.]